MIELSKCPNCASEDRVTIAGKDFCMHCGTASEDNAMIAASGSQAVPASDSPSASSVSKFSNSVPTQIPNQAQVEPQVTNQPITPQPQPAVVTPEVPQPSIAQQVNSAVVAGASAQQAFSAPNPVANQIIPITNTPQPNPTYNTNSQITATAQVANTPNTVTLDPNSQISPNTVQQNDAIVKADNKIAELTSEQSIPTSNPDTVISTLPQEKSTDNLAGALAFASSQNNSSVSPALAPQLISSQAAPAITSSATMANVNPVSKTMPGAESTMTLDKAEPGVFSDEELNALSNTTVESPIATTTSAPQSPIITAPAPPLATPIPAGQASMPLQTTSVASAFQPNQQQASSTMPQAPAIETSDNTQKQSGSKKVLKPLGVVASIALLFVAGYYMWRVNYPSLSFKIASSKAGINATMPGYIPEGYGVKGNIQANPGSVSYSLVNQSNKKIAISQAKSDWDSQALAENYVSPKAENYLAVQAQGLTIYMMGSNQASWVNKGTWYRIESPDQPLTQEQVVKLATSL